MNASARLASPAQPDLRSCAQTSVTDERRMTREVAVDEVLHQGSGARRRAAFGGEHRADVRLRGEPQVDPRRTADGIIVQDGPSVFRMAGRRADISEPGDGRSALVPRRRRSSRTGAPRTSIGFERGRSSPHRWRSRCRGIGGHVRRTGVRVHESLAYELAEPTVRQGIPVTGVARTILDCAPMFDKPIRLLDDALRQTDRDVGRTLALLSRPQRGRAERRGRSGGSCWSGTATRRRSASSPRRWRKC